jgi:hypothetical protein
MLDRIRVDLVTEGGRDLVVSNHQTVARADVRAENEIYAGVLDGPEGVGIRLGIEQAIRAFLDAAQRGERPGAEAGEVWRRLGEAEFQAGRGLEARRAAWRSGTRAAWRGAAMVAGEAGISTPAVVALAEAIFIYTDELATGVFEGYVRMQSDEASERERRRRRLASLLLDAETHDPETIARAAELARFTLPRTLAVLALPGEEPGEVARRLGVEALSGSDREGAFVVVSNPVGPGQESAIARAVGDADSALGPPVAPREAPPVAALGPHGPGSRAARGTPLRAPRPGARPPPDHGDARGRGDGAGLRASAARAAARVGRRREAAAA